MSAAWESEYGNSGSVVAQHEWKGLSKLGGNLEDWVAKDLEERIEREQKAPRYHVPGGFTDEDEDEDDDDYEDEEEDE